MPGGSDRARTADADLTLTSLVQGAIRPKRGASARSEAPFVAHCVEEIQRLGIRLTDS